VAVKKKLAVPYGEKWRIQKLCCEDVSILDKKATYFYYKKYIRMSLFNKNVAFKMKLSEIFFKKKKKRKKKRRRTERMKIGFQMKSIHKKNIFRLHRGSLHSKCSGELVFSPSHHWQKKKYSAFCTFFSEEKKTIHFQINK